MIFFRIVLLPVLFVFAILAIFYFIYRMICKKLYDRMVEKTPENIKSTLMKEPHFELTREEKQNFKKKSSVYGIFIYFVFLIAFVFITFKDHGKLMLLESFLFSSPMALIIIVLLLKDALTFDNRKIYRIKAYCYNITYGRNITYHVVYYDFVNHSLEASSLSTSVNTKSQSLRVGSYADLLATANTEHLRPIDLA